MLTQMTNRVPVLIKSLLDRKLDATEFLIQDHMKIESLFMQIQFLNQVYPRLTTRKGEVKKRRELLFDQIRIKLEKHKHFEESIFYPECEKFEDLKPIIAESYEDHRQVTSLLHDMNALSVDNKHFQAKLQLLMENVRKHVKNEEETLFPQVCQLMSEARLERLESLMRADASTERVIKKKAKKKPAAAA